MNLMQYQYPQEVLIRWSHQDTLQTFVKFMISVDQHMYEFTEYHNPYFPTLLNKYFALKEMDFKPVSFKKAQIPNLEVYL